MGIIAIQEAYKDLYLEQLVDALDVLADRVAQPGNVPSAAQNDIARTAAILRVASFGKDFPQLGLLEVDDASGLPCKSILDILQAHKKFIEEENQDSLPLQGQLVSLIQDSIFRNDFEFAADLQRLKECVFTDRLKSMAFTATRETLLSRGEPLDEGLRYSMTVRGYDLTKSGWLRYDLELYTPGDTMLSQVLRPNPYIRDRGGKIAAKPALGSMISRLFGFSGRRWFDEINATKRMRVGKIAVQHIKGFYAFMDGYDAPLVCDEDFRAMMRKGNFILDYAHVDRDDTDITMEDKFTEGDLEQEAPLSDYGGNLIIDRYRVLTVSPELADGLRRFGKTRKETYVVLS
jgi:hypothetical protein